MILGMEETEIVNEMEQMEKEPEEYLEWLSDMQESKSRRKEKVQLERRILELQQKDVAGLKLRKEA